MTVRCMEDNAELGPITISLQTDLFTTVEIASICRPLAQAACLFLKLIRFHWILTVGCVSRSHYANRSIWNAHSREVISYGPD